MASCRDPILADTDGDRYLDEAECVLGADSTSAASHPSAAQCAAFFGGGVDVNTDTDGDRLKDYIEFCHYNTSRSEDDTDGDAAVDGGDDGCEVASINGDRIVNSLDQGMLAQGIVGVAGYTATSTSTRTASSVVHRPGPDGQLHRACDAVSLT